MGFLNVPFPRREGGLPHPTEWDTQAAGQLPLATGHLPAGPIPPASPDPFQNLPRPGQRPNPGPVGSPQQAGLSLDLLIALLGGRG